MKRTETKLLPIRFKQCAECGKEFQIKKARFCSRRCQDRNWTRRHPGYKAEVQRRYRLDPAHREHIKLYMQQYNHRPEVMKRRKVWDNKKYEANKEFRDQCKRKSRARSLRYKIGHTSAEWETLKAVYGNRCAYCGRKMKRLTKDHIIPISRGDPDTVDAIKNIVPACWHCNSKKFINPPPPFQKVLTVMVVQ